MTRLIIVVLSMSLKALSKDEALSLGLVRSALPIMIGPIMIGQEAPLISSRVVKRL